MALSIEGRPGVRWRPLAQWPGRQRPARALREWLADSGSLTTRLVARSHGHFHVEVLRQQVARPTLSEWRCLSMDRHALALIREVVLCGHNKPWVFARSVLPLTSLTGSLRRLRKQDASPLGAFLFSQPHLRRSAIAVSRISRHHAYVPARLMTDNALWGRRSVFYLADKPLLVSEVFLEPFTQTLAPAESINFYNLTSVHSTGENRV